MGSFERARGLRPGRLTGHRARAHTRSPTPSGGGGALCPEQSQAEGLLLSSVSRGHDRIRERGDPPRGRPSVPPGQAGHSSAVHNLCSEAEEIVPSPGQPQSWAPSVLPARVRGSAAEGRSGARPCSRPWGCWERARPSSTAGAHGLAGGSPGRGWAVTFHVAPGGTVTRLRQVPAREASGRTRED